MANPQCAILAATTCYYLIQVAQDIPQLIYNDDCEGDSCPVETPIDDLSPLHSPDTIGDRPDLEGLSDQDLLDSVRNPENGDPLRENTNTGNLVDGNSRAQELKDRANNPNSSITGDTTVPVFPHTPDNSGFWDL